MVSEIRSYYSLNELSKSLEEEVDFYQTRLEEYNQNLGSLLREMEDTPNNGDWSKELGAFEKSSKKKKGKGKKNPNLTDWIKFKEIMLSKDEKGEAQMLFEAIDEINNKIAQLTKTKETIEDLRKYGLGEDVIYVTYLSNEIPERIVLRRRAGNDSKKFDFEATFSAIRGK